MSDQGRGPKYLALADAIRERIETGALTPEAKLPPVRELAWQLGITPGTVSRAYSALTEEGRLVARVGSGTFVAPRHSEGPPPLVATPLRGEANLRSSVIPEVGQAAVIGAAMARVGASLTAEMVEYPRRADELEVIDALLAFLPRAQTGPASREDVVVTAGAQHALHVAAETLLRGRRRTLIVEELSYPGFRNVGALAQAKVLSIPMDGEGPSAEALDAICARSGPAVFMTSSRLHNPTLVRSSASRRARIVEIARDRDLHIVDDDTFSFGEDEVSGYRDLAPERAWHVASLSKSISPTLRFGSLIAPVGWGNQALTVAQQQMYGLSGLILRVVLDLFRSGEAMRIAADVRAACNRRVVMARGIFGEGPVYDADTPFIWLPLPPHWRASSFSAACAERGVLVKPSDQFAAADGAAPNAVRVYLNGRLSDAWLAEALGKVADLMARPVMGVEP
ncbi:PLP-dependent aminotransferase family protein [Roseicyclus sp. F158]|uniref:PLP-dependent aminotransferase family protein n=1 Tax=Tropicimonas omnivorans TaxID=3075590 RepID=A0ABU3DEH6_9RHOB|nr:PLP-dependent aminotransferase family protein [Roseicyclus sp. F158]MDT0681522.1 PLP-dependent aminotransferase family protein [Roseicyclus sp. F158]